MVCAPMRAVWSVVETSSLVAAASHLSLLSEALASLSLSGVCAATRGDCAKKKNATATTQRINRALIRIAPLFNSPAGKKAAGLRGLALRYRWAKRRDCMLEGRLSQRKSESILSV